MIRALLVGTILLSVGIFVLFGISYAISDKEAYELQERCGKRAADYFKGYVSGIENTEDVKFRTIYTNHYNRKLNKCFILFTTFGSPMSKEDIQKLGISIDKILWDINENKRYGNFFKFHNIPEPMMCEVSDKSCHSEFEWDALAKPYMEE